MISVRFRDADIRRLETAMTKMVQSALMTARNLSYTGAAEYRQSVFDMIVSQSFPVRYPAYDPGYETWKQQAVGHLDFWRLTGALRASLSVIKIDENTWAGGVKPGSVNFSGQSVEEYGLAVEEGLGGRKPRPLFSPAADVYQPKWEKLCTSAFQNITQNWK